jgi:hypothetical protein
VLITDERQRLMEPSYVRGVQNYLRKHLTEALSSAK